MTQQAPDLIQVDGREYVILNWLGDTSCIPDNETLGFETSMQSTANWSGRIDHYGVWGGELYLFKIDVTLDDPDHTPTPIEARREVLFRYEPLTDSEGRSIVREYRHDFFAYEDLKLPFTGRIILARSDDPWARPQAAPDEYSEAAFALELCNGVVEDFYELND